ncbi:MAG TPA: heme o synthase [Gaiellaceae bacterium]|nr:heme o synthase [Gaiellaceae bacterium]
MSERLRPAAPGPWLRLCAVGAAAATAVAVVSGPLGLTHRALVAIAMPPLAALAVAAWQAYPRLRLAAWVAAAAFAGASLTWWLGPAHVALAAVAFAASVVAAALAFRGAPVSGGPWRDYVTLTKPRIMSLLLVTGAGGMFVGAEGVPPLGDLAVMLLGLALACGGASALNHLLDADIDRLMGKRTERRPVAAGRVPPARALEFGLALSAASFVLLASLANVLTAVLALVGNLFYVLVYTRWLKRSTAQNIVIGGAAGAVPPLVGYAAATGSLALPALWLFLVVFLWTPPHFWALALLIKDNYAAARVPMLPVVRGDRETARQILLYSVVMVAFTLAVTPWLGLLYGVAAAVLGGAFLWLAWDLRRDLSRRRAALLFHYSLAYLALLFAAAAIDPVVL